MDLVLGQLFQDYLYGGNIPEMDSADFRIEARPYNLSNLHNVRNLEPTNIDQLVAVQGMVTRVSPPVVGRLTGS